MYNINRKQLHNEKIRYLIIKSCLPSKQTTSFKAALTSFGVVCKAIAHSIQSRLLDVLAKFPGLRPNRTRDTSNFLRSPKTGNYFYGLIVCDVAMCKVGILLAMQPLVGYHLSVGFFSCNKIFPLNHQTPTSVSCSLITIRDTCKAPIENSQDGVIT